jgi:molecular chaperone GrpE (heat shock protein)
MKAIKSKKTTAKSVKAIVTRTKVKAAPKTISKPVPAAQPTSAPASVRVRPAASGSAATIESLRTDMADLRAAVEKSLSPIASGTMDEVDALRRVLSYLFEAKNEEIIRELVTIRHASAALPGGARNVTEQIDALLANLGAVKFEAERLEHVDPLIHAITREVRDEKLDDAIIAEAIRPGFRTARGVVIAKALVAINRRA